MLGCRLQKGAKINKKRTCEVSDVFFIMCLKFVVVFRLAKAALVLKSFWQQFVPDAGPSLEAKKVSSR